MSLNGTNYASIVEDLNWDAVQVRSFIPGRLRVQSEQLRDEEALGARIGEALESVDAVTHVAVTSRTGSVLVKYDEGQVPDPSSLIERADALGVLPEGVQPDDLKRRMQAQTEGASARDFRSEVRSVFSSLNATVDEATGGALDLKGLVPLWLVGMGTYRLFTGATSQSLPWFNYFWFAFSIYVALDSGASNNRTSIEAERDDAVASSDVQAAPAAS